MIRKPRPTMGFTKVSAKPLKECQKECVKQAKCIGVAWHPRANACYFGGSWYSGTPEADMRRHGVTYYKLTRTCPAPAPNSSKR